MKLVDGRMFDTPAVSDNRAYDYTGTPELERAEYPIIESLIPPGSRVLDLGCGNGSPLRRLARKGVHGVGWDISASGIAACVAAGISAEVREIDTHHSDVAEIIRFHRVQRHFADDDAPGNPVR